MGKRRGPHYPGHGMKPKQIEAKYTGGIGWCEQHQKVWFASRSQARKFLRVRFAHDTMNVYRCDRFWHIGHLVASAKAGKTGRDGKERAA